MKMTKTQMKDRRHKRVRARVIGTAERPRLAIFKSNTRIVAQIIDDSKGVTIAGVSSSSEKAKKPLDRAIASAKTLAEMAKAKGVTKVVFDRGGFQYIGTVKSFADAAREAGLQF
ncbi:50S ribosomal protein L18 [bacterium]|nr:50S ribosomal protein L18 [bacterium]